MQSAAKPLSADDVLAAAYRYLNRRERSVAEVREYLATRGAEADAIEQAIDTLTEQNYVDDSRFARVFVEDKRALEQWGSERIRRALAERGIPNDVIDAQLEAQAPQRELDRALELLARRFPSAPRTRRERDRALGMLLRKGYPSHIAFDALAAHVRDGSAGDLLE